MSIELSSASLREALVAILDGCSYTVSPAADTWMVNILSTMPRARTVRPSCARAELRHVAAGVNGSVIAKPDFLTGVGTADADEPLVEIPTSLDEFEPLNEGDDPDVDSEDDEGQDLTARSERQQRYNDAVLNRALNALRSPNQNLRLEAINALGGLEDDRVADVLVEAANDRSNENATLRAEAVSGLYRNSAAFGFANGRAVDTLKQLAEDADHGIRSIAQSALRDMAQYERENAAQ
ncbi:MAG: HEAT repeat domain-containing protein [Chromatiales bacterium]